MELRNFSAEHHPVEGVSGSEHAEDENRHSITIAMTVFFDPLFTLQLLFAVFVVVTLQDEPARTEATKPERITHAPFQLIDGNTYVEHAGMTIEQDLYLNLFTRGQEVS